MAKGINLIKNKYVAHTLAVILICIALAIETVEFVMSSIDYFSYQTLFAYVFEIITNGLLIYALLRKKPLLVELSLVILKVFEATFYPLESCERLDTLLKIDNLDTFYIVTHVLFAIAAFSLLFGLIFFCIYKLKDNIKYWDIMKIWVLIASVFMAVIAILYAIEIVKNDNMPWEEILEPVALCILFLGMFMTYEYVEEVIIYGEETSAS